MCMRAGSGAGTWAEEARAARGSPATAWPTGCLDGGGVEILQRLPQDGYFNG